jgi:uncharacterized membrane protein YgcG
MVNSKALILIPLAVGTVSIANPVYAQTIAQTTVIEFKQTNQSLFESFRSKLQLSGIDARLEVVGNVPTNMQDYTRSKLNETATNAKALMIVIATDRENKIGSKPAIRLEGKNYALSQSELDSILNNSYYPALKAEGFDSAFGKLLSSIESKVAPSVQYTQAPQIQSKVEKVSEQSDVDSTLLIFFGICGGGIASFALLSWLLASRNYDNTKPSTSTTTSDYTKSSTPSKSTSSKSTSYKSTPSTRTTSRTTRSSGYSSSGSYDYGGYSSSDSGSSSSDSGGGDGGGDCGGGD